MSRAPSIAAAALGLALAGSSAAQPAPRVVRVQPSAAEVPANLLRISIEFAAPIEGPVLNVLALRHADGRPLEQPFLQQELWSPSGKILTFLLNPGRVKTGLNAREEMGPILSTGDDVVLTLNGQSLKRWRVGQVDAQGPAISTWRLSTVRAASRQALVVTLDGAIDGRDVDYLAVADTHGRRVNGRARLTDGERIWTFTPDRPWRIGVYKLVVRGTLEDPAGNRLGGHFETSTSTPAEHASDAVRDVAVIADR